MITDTTIYIKEYYYSNKIDMIIHYPFHPEFPSYSHQTQ